MRSSLLLVGSLVLAGAAIAVGPQGSTTVQAEGLSPPPTSAMLRVASLGRYAAAADVLWLRSVQYIGAPYSADLHYEGLPAWLERIHDLDPLFELPYYHGGILLSTEPGMTPHAKDIFERAERNLVADSCRDESACVAVDRSTRERAFETCAPCPALTEQDCNWALPMSRAFVAFFGELDATAAAAFYCTAARRGGPPVARHRAATLSETAATCPAIRAELVEIMRRGETAAGASMLTQNRLRIALHCEEEALKKAMGSFRVRFLRNPRSVDELLEAGLLDRAPWTPSPSQCWNLKELALEECPR